MTPWIWALLISIMVVIWIIWKYVIIPSITVATDKDSYDRSEGVQISGDLKDQADAGIPDKTVTIAVEDPGGTVYPTITVQTGADGSYAATWEIPDDAAGGTYTVTASALGISASKTFRQMIQKIVAV